MLRTISLHLTDITGLTSRWEQKPATRTTVRRILALARKHLRNNTFDIDMTELSQAFIKLVLELKLNIEAERIRGRKGR